MEVLKNLLHTGGTCTWEQSRVHMLHSSVVGSWFNKHEDWYYIRISFFQGLINSAYTEFPYLAVFVSLDLLDGISIMIEKKVAKYVHWWGQGSPIPKYPSKNIQKYFRKYYDINFKKI